ncbi:MAG TPA: hypothetical protein PLV92_22600 [Pirellulaceae bacterium]|nr:hypothetical protein [Pirellulaceae bacterium]
MKTLRSIVTVACALSLAGCGLDVMYADWKVDRLCKHDGGVKVFETDSPPAEFRMPDGNVDIEALYRAKPGQSYHLTHGWTKVKSTEPEIVRLEIRLLRDRDSKLLGTSVTYIRPVQSQGIPFLHRDGYTCPRSGELEGLIASVFFPNSIAK